MTIQGRWFTQGSYLLCRRVFAVDPERMCSHPWPPPDRPLAPICRPCITEKVARMQELEVPQSERPAEPGERCTRGRQAIVVYRGSIFGPASYCGISDGGEQAHQARLLEPEAVVSP